MERDDRLAAAMRRAIEALNRELPPERRIGGGPEVRLAGEGGGLESLGLVNLIVAVESEIEREFGVQVTLADALATIGEPDHPFATTANLVAHLGRIVAAEGR